MSDLREIFTPEAEARIRTAVNAAEGGTSGEIVPFVVAESDSYEGALWKAAVLGALLASLVAVAVWGIWQPWGVPIVLWIVGPPLAGAGLGYLAAGALPPVRRALIGVEVIERRVERRAGVAFLEEEVFNTRDRTGILLFLSLFERRVVVVGDEGINRKVAAGEWQGLVERLVTGIKEERAVEALVGAIGECGELLERRGLETGPEDSNELSDDLRSRER